MKLSKFIPEIKIVPNIRKIERGQVYNCNKRYLYDIENEFEEFEIVDIEQDEIILYNINTGAKVIISIPEFKQGQKLGQIKYLRQE